MLPSDALTLDKLLAPPPTEATAFPPPSRYAGVEIAREMHDGQEVRFVRRRFPPLPETVAVGGTHTMAPRERLDAVAHRSLGLAELFWMLCDANGAMTVAELERPGVVLRLPDAGAAAGGAYG